LQACSHPAQCGRTKLLSASLVLAGNGKKQAGKGVEDGRFHKNEKILNFFHSRN
jgi:hypothetical protein